MKTLKYWVCRILLWIQCRIQKYVKFYGWEFILLFFKMTNFLIRFYTLLQPCLYYHEVVLSYRRNLNLNAIYETCFLESAMFLFCFSRASMLYVWETSGIIFCIQDIVFKVWFLEIFLIFLQTKKKIFKIDFPWKSFCVQYLSEMTVPAYDILVLWGTSQTLNHF